MNVILQNNKRPAELAEFLHGCCGSPTKSTFLKAIKNNHFISWPGLTEALVEKHLGPCIATSKGHIHQEAKNLQSTKMKQKLEEAKIIEDQFPTSDKPNKKTNQVIYAMLGDNRSGKGYIDLAGKFPFVSNR